MPNTPRWEDMGSPAYQHPSQPAPGHIVGLTWDSAVPKFGIDRGAGVWNDLGNPDRFRLECDMGPLTQELKTTWRGQCLADGLPILTTRLAREPVRVEIEQFAYPLHGPPSEAAATFPWFCCRKSSSRIRAMRRKSYRCGSLTGASAPPVQSWQVCAKGTV